MNNLNEAVKLAIEKGGYNPEKYPKDEYYDGDRVNLMSPLFWRSLGKALGWGNGKCVECKIGSIARCPTKGVHTPIAWKTVALCFFELRMTGGDEAKFWIDLY